MDDQVVDEDLQHFAHLAQKSFGFWENSDDDIYQEFYKNKMR